MDQVDVRALCFETAAKVGGLDGALLYAQASVESSLNPYAERYEPTYPWLWDVTKAAPLRLPGTTPPIAFPAITPCSGVTEWNAQKRSYGLLQVMGANVRAMDYGATYLGRLAAEPELALYYGARYLRTLVDRYNDITMALLRYNGGADVGYADKVFQRAGRLTAVANG